MTDIDNARMKPQSGVERRGSVGERIALVLRKAALVMRMGREPVPGTGGSVIGSENAPSAAGGREMLPQAGPQVGRLSDVVASAARHSARAQECHDGASVRVDAALYELEQLREELKAVIDPRLLAGASELPGAVASHSGRAVDGPDKVADVIKGGRAGSARSAA